MKSEQVSGLEQMKQKGAESLIEPIIQPELETLHSFDVTPDKNHPSVSLPNGTNQEVLKKRVPEQKKELKAVKSIVQQPKAKAEQPSVTKIKTKETSNVVKSNDGFWD